MRIENLTELMNANNDLINVAKSKARSMIKLRDWIAGFEENDPPTQAQIDVKIAKLGMTDLQDAFNSEKTIFLNPDVIPDPLEEPTE